MDWHIYVNIYVQRLIIFNLGSKVYHGVAKLINVQNNLKYFEWEDDHELSFIGPDYYKEILIALEKKDGYYQPFKIILPI
jgi:hypothetical protein